MSRVVVLGVVAGLVRSAVAELLAPVSSDKDVGLALGVLELQDELEERGVIPSYVGESLTLGRLWKRRLRPWSTLTSSEIFRSSISHASASPTVSKVTGQSGVADRGLRSSLGSAWMGVYGSIRILAACPSVFSRPCNIRATS